MKKLLNNVKRTEYDKKINESEYNIESIGNYSTEILNFFWRELNGKVDIMNENLHLMNERITEVFDEISKLEKDVKKIKEKEEIKSVLKAFKTRESFNEGKDSRKAMIEVRKKILNHGESSYRCKLISGQFYSMKKQIKDRLMMLTKVLLTEDEKNGDYSEIDDLLNGINLDDFKKMITEHFNNFQNTRRRVKKKLKIR